MSGMGTKIEHAFDPLTATSTNSNSSFTLPYRVDDWNYLQARKLNKFHKTDNNFSDSMEKMLQKHNIESIKKTMQIQEEIFKHQVRIEQPFCSLFFFFFFKIQKSFY